MNIIIQVVIYCTFVNSLIEICQSQTINVKPKLEATFSEVDFSIRLNWTFPGQWNGRYLITYSSNNSISSVYFIMRQTIDYMDPNELVKISKDLDECHGECWQNAGCLAYSYNQTDNNCRLKFNTSTSPIDCASTLTCSNVKAYEGSYLHIGDVALNTIFVFQIKLFNSSGSTPYSDPVNVSTDLDVKLEQLGNFIEQSFGLLACKPYLRADQVSYAWFKNDLPLDVNASNVSLDENQLRFHDLNHLLDDGTYQCRIVVLKTSQLVHSNQVNVQVLHKASISIVPDDKVIRLNVSDALNLTCVVDAYPYEHPAWISDSQAKMVSSQTTLTYSILLVKPWDNGTYTCCSVQTPDLCTNIDVIVQDVASQPVIHSAVYYLKDREILLNWTVEHTGNLNIDQAMIELKLVNRNQTNNIVVTNASQIDAGLIRIKSPWDDAQNIEVRMKVENLLGYGAYGPFVSLTVEDDTGSPSVRFSTIVPITICVLFVCVIFVVALSRFEKKNTSKNRFEMNPTNDESDLTSQHSYAASSRSSSSTSSDDSNQQKASRVRLESLKRKVFKKIESRTQLHHPESNLPSVNKRHVENIYDNHQNVNMEEIGRAHNLDELLENWNDAVERNQLDEHFQNEHQNLKNPNYLKIHDALLDHNLPKSNYKIYPYDFNRVKLSIRDDVPGSDFINASHIEGYNGSKKFIAAQAPSRDTVDDFLRMIFEKQIKCVVMLCKFREETPMKTKCYPFWNDAEEIRIGDVRVKSLIVDNKCSYMKRRLILVNERLNVQHELDHYQYADWPDRGMPDEEETVMAIIERVNLEHGAEADWPILVFCNNGIGRTGVYILLDIVQETLQNTDYINIRQILYSLRMQRTRFVETWEQYKFISLALLQRHLFGNTTVTRNLLELSMNKLNCVQTPNTKSFMEIEYNKIGKFVRHEKTSDYYKEYPDKFKSNTFIPYDDSLVEINKSCDDPRERYIDAVMFEPSQIDTKFIIASDADESSMENFIKLLFIHRPSILVSLSKNVYVPNLNENITFHNYKITNCRLQNLSVHGLFDIYEIEFLNLRDDNKLIVNYFAGSKIWPEDDCLPDVDAFTKLVHTYLNVSSDIAHETNDILTSVIHCHDAGDRCGLFVCASVLLNSLLVANQFNVPKIVRQIRNTKAKLIGTFARYQFLYEVCAKFVAGPMNRLVSLDDS